MLSVGAIHFEDRFCAGKNGGIGRGGWVSAWPCWNPHPHPHMGCHAHGSYLGWMSKSLGRHWLGYFSPCRSLSEAIYTLYDPYFSYFHFCYELALKTSAKCSIQPLRVHDFCHTHSLASLQWSGPSNQWMLLPTENCQQCQKWSP